MSAEPVDTLPAGLFTPEEIGRLERLRIRRRRVAREHGPGEWRSTHHGTSGLFADHRAYVAGDDPRYVDWNVYGRLDSLVVKRFEAEANINLLLCVDRSLSMAGRKSYAARRLAGALGFLALAHHDHVRLSWLPNREGCPLSAYRSRGIVQGFFDVLATTPDDGSTDHVRDLARIAARIKGRGLAVLVSDFFDPAGAIRGLALLRGRGMEVGALHIVDPADADLPVGASIVAVDRESGESMVVNATRAVQQKVRQAWIGRQVGLERWCLSRSIRYSRVDARESLWDVLKGLLRSGEGVGV